MSNKVQFDRVERTGIAIIVVALILLIIAFACPASAQIVVREPIQKRAAPPTCSASLENGTLCLWTQQPATVVPCPPSPPWIPVTMFATLPGGGVAWTRAARVAVEFADTCSDPSAPPVDTFALEILVNRRLRTKDSCGPIDPVEAGHLVLTIGCVP